MAAAEPHTPHHRPFSHIYITINTPRETFRGVIIDMDITAFAIGNRESALLIGDYNSYRSQLSRKLLAVRRRLGRATPKNAKFQQKPPVTAEDIKKNKE